MATVQWSETLSVGNAQIDDDHRQLFRLLDRLQLAMKQGKANTVMGGILDELVGYTVTHFQREEQFMRRIGYADFAAHKAEHDKLIAQVQDLQARFKSGAITLSISTHQFLGDWLNSHIMQSDMKLARALASAA